MIKLSSEAKFDEVTFRHSEAVRAGETIPLDANTSGRALGNYEPGEIGIYLLRGDLEPVDWERKALHEACHAWAAHICGCRVARLEIGDGDRQYVNGDGARGFCEYRLFSGAPQNIRPFVLMAPAEVASCAGLSPTQGDCIDYGEARAYTQDLLRLRNEIYGAYDSGGWLALQTLANELFEQKTLNAAQIKEILK